MDINIHISTKNHHHHHNNNNNSNNNNHNDNDNDSDSDSDNDNNHNHNKNSCLSGTRKMLPEKKIYIYISYMSPPWQKGLFPGLSFVQAPVRSFHKKCQFPIAERFAV